MSLDGDAGGFANTTAEGSSTILLEHKALFSGGDYGSGFFRIPAITNGLDGSLVVISEDGGETWGAPYFQNDLIDPFVNGELIRREKSGRSKASIDEAFYQ